MPSFGKYLRGVVLLLAALQLAVAPAWAQDAPPAEPAAADSAAPMLGPTGEPLISIAFAQTKVEQVAQKLSEKSGKNVVARGKTLGQPVTLIMRNQPLEYALDQIVNQKPNWLWQKGSAPNSFDIWDQESFQAEVLPTLVRQKAYQPREITAEEAYKAIQGVLTPNIGAASFDARSNKVIVTDLPAVLELIQRLIEQIDVKFVTRVFYIAHADVQSIVDKLTNLKSPAAPAIDFDVRTHLVIVRDRLEIIRQMELLVETLDVGPELRVYDLNTIGYEGADKAELEEAIQQVLTPDAYYNINTLSGKLLVEDVAEVHEKIEKILEAFDQPSRQVLLQAEIVETQFGNGFNYSIDYTLSGDLFSSVIDGLTGRASTGSEAAATAGGSVPTGKGDINNGQLGFINFRNEFPIVQAGSSGLDARWLSRHAYISLKAAMSDSRSRILQQPRILTMNQKEVSFAVGQQIPFFSGGNFSSNNNNNQFNTGPVQQRIDVGLTLIVRPVILANGLVQMEVEVTNNTAFKTTEVFAGQAYTAIGTNNQELASVLIIPSGETRVIGGLVSDTRSETRSGVPGLMKIPVLGPALFGSYTRPEDQNLRRNLLIFLTPTIIEEQVKDMRRFKGRIVAEESMIDTLVPLENDPTAVLPDATLPDATLSDTWLEPLPVSTPNPRPSTRMENRATQTPLVGEVDAQWLSPQTDQSPATAEPMPLEPPPPVAPAEPQGGLVDLTRVAIADVATTGVGTIVPRGPSGALTGPGAFSGAASGSATAPPPRTTPRAAAAPPPPPPQQQAGAGQAGAGTQPTGAAPVDQGGQQQPPPATPPPTETRM